MLEIAIRRGTAGDASLITELIKEMVVEMTNYGGYTVNTSPDVWTSTESEVRTNSACQEYIYLLAQQPLHTTEVVGMAAGSIEVLEEIFVAEKRLHISALYTIPSARRHGVARQLLYNLLEWGKQMNAREIELNVLVANPARQLYEQFGFMPREISMTRNLKDD
jgi:ribosomal protein S18 acetylase RimI-like enzyme